MAALEHGVKYVQGFTALGTCFARIRTQLFHNHVPGKHGIRVRATFRRVSFDLFIRRRTRSRRVPLLFGEPRGPGVTVLSQSIV